MKQTVSRFEIFGVLCIVLKAGKVRTIVLIGILTVVSYHGFKTSTMMC